MYNLGNRFGQNRSVCNNRQYGTMGIVKQQPIEQMTLKPEYLANEHFRFLNNFGLQQQHLMSEKKFVDINNCVNTNRPSQCSSSYIMPECNSKAYSINYNQTKQPMHKEEEPPQTVSLKQPKKMKRNKSGACSNNDRKNSKKARKQRKCSKRESDRNICESLMSPRKQPKSGKAWHKKSLKMEMMEIDEEEDYEPLASPAPIEICAATAFCMGKPASVSITVINTPQNVMGQQTEKKAASTVQQVSFRPRLPSECESEDSFIVFDSDCCEGSEVESSDESSSDDDESDEDVTDGFSISFNGANTEKKVRFASDKELCEVHPMVQWSFAYQKARKGPWEQYALDRMRFRKRVSDAEPALNRILEPAHRSRVYEERFRNKDASCACNN